MSISVFKLAVWAACDRLNVLVTCHDLYPHHSYKRFWPIYAKNDTTYYRVTAERAMNARLQGGCQVPIGSFAQLNGDTLELKGLVGEADGSRLIEATASGSVTDAEVIGQKVAEQLLAQGADTILAKLSDTQ